MSSLQAKLQHKYALSEKGAKDMIKAFVSVTCSDLVLMFPVWMLYFLVRDYLQGTMAGRGVFYIVGCVLCLLLIALTTLVQYRATFLATYVESGVRRIALAEQLRKIPLSFFGKKDLSDLTSTIMADCATMETASSHFIPELVGSCISTTLIAVGTFFMNWRMAIAALWVLPVSFLIVGCSGRVQKSLSKKQMKLKMDCADGIQECLETVRDLRVNNAQAEYMEGLEGKIRAVEKHALVTELGTAVFVGGAQMILKLGIATVALIGSVLLVQGEIDILTFFVFLLLVSRMYDPLQVALQNLAAIISTSVQCDRLDEILSHEIQTGADTMDPKGYDIVFSHVGFSYDSQDTVLRDVTFTAKQGEVTALIGPSGGGKTTLCNLIPRFYDVTSGHIYIDGQDIQHVTLKSLRQDIGIVQQDVYLFSGSVAENIAYGKPGATREEIVEAARLAGAERFILALKDGFDTYVGERGVKLSGGQKQRIAIARALATNPKVLLCDEATSALDPNTTHAILTLIKDINKKLGITVVVITHQMSVVEEICDSVAILDGGVVVEQGEVREIFANPKTAAARRLVAPNGGSAARDLSSFAPDDHVVRVTFNGSSTAKPLVASLAAEKGILVSVLSADTRDLSGQCYGSMLLKLPADLDEAKQAAAYMRAQPGITVEEVTGE